MEPAEFSHCSTPRVRSFRGAHSYLCAKSKKYEAWHVHPKHRKVHISVLSLVLILFGWFSGIIAIQFMHNRTHAAALTYNLNTKDQWDAGTNTNIDTEDLPGSMRIKPAGTWGAMTLKNPPKPISSTSGAYGDGFESVGNDIYVMRGGGDSDFWKYSPLTDTWTVLTNVPTGVGLGGDLCTGETTDILYAIVGNTTKKFYKYTISTNAWDTMPDLQDTSVYGSSIVSNGSFVYFLRSGGTTDFFKYDIAAKDWAIAPNTGIGNIPTVGGNVGYGSNLVWDGGDFLYALKGGGTQNFFRFSISGNAWVAMTNYSFAAVNLQTASIYKNGKVYIMYGNTTPATTFIKVCTISGLNCTEGAGWGTLAGTIPGGVYFGGIGTIAAQTDSIYLFRGYGSFDTWKYDTLNGKFVMPPNFPVTPAVGSDLFYDGGNVVYALLGGTNFYYWNKATDITWTQCTAAGVVCKNTNLPNLAGDTKTAVAGTKIYLINSGATTIFSFDMSAPANGWTSVTTSLKTGSAALGNFGNGGGLAYVASSNRLYAVRGGNTREFYYLDLADNKWSNVAANYLPTGMNVNTGGRIVAVGDNVYTLLGNGNSNFYKWDGAGWSKMARAPFSPYYGTDLTSYNGKIYALAGYYKSEFYEYSGTTWRRLNSLSSATPYDQGTYIGASIRIIGSNTLMITRGSVGSVGQSVASYEALTYTIDSNNYQASASYESPQVDLTYAGGWPSLTVTKTEPNGSTVVIKTKSRNEGESWPDSWTGLDGSGKIASAAKRYLKVQATLTPSAGNADSPTLTSLGIGYDPDEEKPTPPTVATGKSQASSGLDLVSGNSYNYSHPYFEWSSPEQPNGATDNGKSGVAGYYVSFTQSSSDDPSSFQTATSFVVNDALTTGTYYLRIKAKDNAGNTTNAANTVFTYVYNGIANATPITKTLDAELSANATISNTTVAGDQIKLASKAGFWKEGRLNPSTPTVTTGGSIVYKGSKVYMNPGGAITFFEFNPATNVWTSKASLPAGATIGDGGALVNGPGNYIYAMRGGGFGKFYRYDITNDAAGWDDVNAEDAPDVFTTGGYLIYDGSRYIYGVRGADWAFYRFDPNTGGADGQWEGMANMNFGYPDRTGATTVGGGAAIAYDGADTIYAIQGSTYQGGFAKYSIASNTWTPMIDSSYSPARDVYLPVAPSTASNLMWDSINGGLLYLVGSITTTNSLLYRFNPTTKDWTKLASTPGGVGAGAWWARDGDTVYLARGGSTSTFYKYSIAKNFWYTPTFGLFGPQFNGTTLYNAGQGANLVKGDANNVYAIRGLNDNQFVRYNTSTGTTTRMAKLPTATSSGYTSMVYDSVHNNIYVMLGDTETYLTKWFVYSISGNSWTEEIISSPATMGQPGPGASMTFDGTEFIYSTRGSSTLEWYRYSTNTHAWSVALPTTNLGTLAAGSEILYNGGNIYVLRGNAASNPLYKVAVSGLPSIAVWSTVNTWAVVDGADGTLADGGDGYMYAARAAASVYDWYRCAFPTVSVPNPAWEKLADVPGGTAAGGAAAANAASYKVFSLTGPGTNSYSDGLYTYVEQTANSSFQESGSYIGGAINLTQTYHWANLSVSYTQPANTTLTISTQSSIDGSTWPANWDGVSEEKVSGSTHQFRILSAEKQYIRVKFDYISGDGVLSPTVTDYSVNYYLDQTPPTNPTSLTSAKSAATNGVDIADDHWNKYPQPSFTWPAAEASNGATDGTGSGVAGYYIYFGEANDQGVCQGDPRSTAGILTPNENLLYYQTSNTFTVPANTLLDAQSGKSFCLRTTSKDNAGNVQAATWQVFKYKFDNQLPGAPSSVSVSPQDYSSTNSFEFNITGGSSDTGSSILNYQYRTSYYGADDWHDFGSDENAKKVTLTDLCHTDGGQEVCHNYENTFYVRAQDAAGNFGPETSKKFYYFKDTAIHLTVDQAVKEENNFTFNWDNPAGKPDNVSIDYYYSVNVDPSTLSDPLNNISVIKANSRTIKGALAEKAGVNDEDKNIFYVVAAVNNAINWKNPVTVNFWANLSAPDPPSLVKVKDISEKDDELDIIPVEGESNYRIVVSWKSPEHYDPRTQFFRIYATTTPDIPDSYEGNIVGISLDKSFVHDNLPKDSHYYYYVKTVDQTGIESMPSNNPYTTEKTAMPNDFASGRYKTAPLILSEDKCTNALLTCDSENKVGYVASARAAVMNWNTSRPAKPEVQYGKTKDNLDETAAVSRPILISDHEVQVDGLNPDTTYYYRAVYTDSDGNSASYPPIDQDPLSFTTSPAPKVSTMKVEDISMSGMLITWQSSVASHGSVTYKKSNSTTYEKPVEEREDNFSTAHSAKLENLENGTSYTFQINAIDTEDNIFQSDEYVQETLPMPKVNDDLKAENKTGIDSPTIDISYTTNVDTTTVIKYSTGGSGPKTFVDLEKKKAHTAEISGLAPKAPYVLEVTGADNFGNEAIAKTFQITTESDTMPPKIVSMSEKKRVIGDGANAEAQITVKLTSNEPTTMIVEATEGVGGDAFSIVSNEDPLNTEHTVPLKLKQAGKTYSYRVSLKDAAGNPTVSEVKTVVIQQANKTAFEYTLSIFARSFGWLSAMFKP